MMVAVPPGVPPGTAIPVHAPTGQLVHVTVPHGVPPGGSFMVQLPTAAPQPQPLQPPPPQPPPLREMDLTVTIPPGAKAGAKFPFTAPDGKTVYLVCPKPKPLSGTITWRFIPRGARPGAAMQLTVAPPAPVQGVQIAPPAGSMLNVTVPQVLPDSTVTPSPPLRCGPSSPARPLSRARRA
eukprot:4332858-Prymnesium_polylepis.1